MSIALLGANPYALRLTAAVIGAATVPAVYWITRETFIRTNMPARWLALWTALFWPCAYWHISLSRIGLQSDYGAAGGCTGIWVVLASLVANG